VLILLPPSEGKTAPASGAPLDLASLAYPELTATRERVLRAVVRLSDGRPARALAALGLSQAQAAQLVEIVAASGREVERTTGRGGTTIDVIYRDGTG
jgi:hypothetical protein